MKIIFRIDGGIGKCVAATAVCKAIKRQYPKEDLIVLSGYPEVFINNPHVKKSLHTNGLTYFYDDYIASKDSQLMLHNPYLETSYVNEEKHLIETWCSMFGVEYKGELPEVFMTQRELEYFQKNFASDKPILVIQTNGGANGDLKYSFARDLPSSVVVKVIDHFAPTHTIVHVRREDQIGYQNTVPLHAGFREIVALTLLSEKRLLIDSFLQHTCTALGLSSTVCWVSNKPKVLGYELHNNIIANPYTKSVETRNSYLQQIEFTGNPEQFAYNSEQEIFNIEEIINSLENGKKPKEVKPKESKLKPRK